MCITSFIAVKLQYLQGLPVCVSINIHISFIVCSDVIFLIYYDCFVSLLIVISYSFIILLTMNVIHCLYYLFFTRWILNVFEMLHINVWISPFLSPTYFTRVIPSPVLPSVPTSIFILNFLFFNLWFFNVRAGKGMGVIKIVFIFIFDQVICYKVIEFFFFFFLRPLITFICLQVELDLKDLSPQKTHKH